MEQGFPRQPPIASVRSPLGWRKTISKTVVGRGVHHGTIDVSRSQVCRRTGHLRGWRVRLTWGRRAGGGASLAEVTVTGSRIVRDGISAPTPVTVVGADRLQNLGATKRRRVAEHAAVLPREQ